MATARGVRATRRSALAWSLLGVMLVFGACSADATTSTGVTSGGASMVAGAPTTIARTPPTEPSIAPPSSTSTTSTAAPTPTTAAPVSTVPPTDEQPDVDPSCPARPDLLPRPNAPVPVILDTDFAADVDDVGALAVLHALADAGEIEILAVMVSDGGDEPSHRAIDAINTYYGRPDVPIGVVDGAAPAFSSTYVDEIATRFPNDIVDPPAALELYRQVLEAQPDGSVTIVSVGYLTNLEALLSSQADGRSGSSGADLVASKVERWIAMGGAYPDSAVHPFGAEFNFVEDATATAGVVANWPTPAIFSGWEVGDAILTGAELQDLTPPTNPVREAYRLFNGGVDRHSWDLTAVLVAARGPAGLFEVCAGRNLIGPGAINTWEPDADGPHGYLRLTVPADEAAEEISELLTRPPMRP